MNSMQNPQSTVQHLHITFHEYQRIFLIYRQYLKNNRYSWKNFCNTCGEWRRGISPLRSLRTGLEPLGSSGSHYPAFVNGFTFFTGSSHKMVDLWIRLDNPPPSLQTHYRPSSLLRSGPPLCSASVLSFLWVLHLNFSLNIGTTGSHVAHESLNQVHAASIPDAVQPVNRYHLNLSRDSVTPRFWHRLFVFDTWSAVHLYSSPWFLPDKVSPCLFLNAHHTGSLPMQLKVVWSQFL